jgi:membrane protein CcdC involved in cytochrome C biogenesis
MFEYELEIPSSKMNTIIVNLLIRNLASTQALLAVLPAFANNAADFLDAETVKIIAETFAAARKECIVGITAEIEKQFGL